MSSAVVNQAARLARVSACGRTFSRLRAPLAWTRRVLDQLGDFKRGRGYVATLPLCLISAQPRRATQEA